MRKEKKLALQAIVLAMDEVRERIKKGSFLEINTNAAAMSTLAKAYIVIERGKVPKEIENRASEEEAEEVEGEEG